MPSRTPSDTQLVLLSAASQREDHLIAIHERLKGGAATKVAENLIASGLAEEVPAQPQAPRWRSSEDERPLALRITAAGLAAIGLETESTKPSTETASPSSEESAQASVPTNSNPKSGSKLARVIELMSRHEGASIVELIETTGWQPHTTRAAITGLRKRGFRVERTKDDSSTSRYRAAAAPDAGSEDAA